MTIRTKTMNDQLQSLLDASRGGLPADLGRFIRMSVRGVKAIEQNCTRQELQEYIDVLRDLVSVKLNSL